MAVPTTRSEFKSAVLRRLGDGVIQINVSDAQVEDRIDYALLKARDYHFDFSARTYVAHQVTAEDRTNKYIILPDDVLEVYGVFDTSSTLMGGTIFNLRYQFALTNFEGIFRALDLSNYVIVLQNLQLLEQVLVGKTPVRWNRYNKKLHVDADWEHTFPVDSFIMIEAWLALDAEDPDNVHLWGDPWLLEYATAQVKQMWGNNLKKYGNIQMPGGIIYNGQQIYDEAEREIEKLESRLMLDYSIPPLDMMG